MAQLTIKFAWASHGRNPSVGALQLDLGCYQGYCATCPAVNPANAALTSIYDLNLKAHLL